MRRGNLSACTTAMARAGMLREEVIHLATAFQLAEFPHVIGTLWNINDRPRTFTRASESRAARSPRLAGCRSHFPERTRPTPITKRLPSACDQPRIRETTGDQRILMCRLSITLSEIVRMGSAP